jgi:hypothetical protein
MAQRPYARAETGSEPASEAALVRAPRKGAQGAGWPVRRSVPDGRLGQLAWLCPRGFADPPSAGRGRR